MSSTEELFYLYLSETDWPIFPEKENLAHANKEILESILENAASIEEAVENTNSVIYKRLVLNPFLDEDLRCELFEKIANSDNSDEKFSEICQESYFTNNLVANCKNIVRRTGSILDWKLSKHESIRKLSEKFIDKYIDLSKIDVLDQVNNKIFNNC